ncbi:mitochondrial DNA repair [Branchiostoma belcheri]|nr:mitochondrial DNA repair [Branchiostoma belcheri]
MFSWTAKTVAQCLQRPARCALILPVCNIVEKSRGSAFHTQQCTNTKTVPGEQDGTISDMQREKIILDAVFGPVVPNKRRQRKTPEQTKDKDGTEEGKDPASAVDNDTTEVPSANLGLPPDLQYMLAMKQKTNRSQRAMRKQKKAAVVDNVLKTSSEVNSNDEQNDYSSPECADSRKMPPNRTLSVRNTAAVSFPQFPMTSTLPRPEPPVQETPMTVKPERRTDVETGNSVPDLGMPSVGSILRKTMPPESVLVLERWKARMISELGEEGFKKLQEDTFREGQAIHTAIDALLTGTPEGELTIPEETQGHWASIQHVLADISDVCAVESVVKHPELQYGGILDCVAKYRGQWCLVDWKTSKRLKPTLKQCYDIPLQATAYMGALNYDDNYSFQVEKALLVIAYGNGDKGHAHLLPPALTEHYWKQWLKRLHQFNARFRHT